MGLYGATRKSRFGLAVVDLFAVVLRVLFMSVLILGH